MEEEPIAYADPASWEEWQREYRYGAFFIFPPVGVIEAIDALRGLYDPHSAAICQAHISLSAPLPRGLARADLADLRARLASIAPFAIRYGPLRSFFPYPGVAYTIAPEDNFEALRSTVHASALFANAAHERSRIAPHMTIAEFITAERTEALLRELSGRVPVGTFSCAAIEYAVPDRDFCFERVLTLSLGTGH